MVEMVLLTCLELSAVNPASILIRIHTENARSLIQKDFREVGETWHRQTVVCLVF